MNFAPDDIERSLKRWAAAITGQHDEDDNEWTIRTEKAQLADEERPVVVVEATDEAQPTFARSSIPQGDLEMRQPFTATVYPSTQGTAADAKHRARQLADLFTQAVLVGLVDDDGALLTHPLAIPIYDYVAVPIKGQGRGGPADPYGQAQVDDVAVRTIPDPLDDKRWTVTCAFRLSWWQSGRLRASQQAGPVVGGVSGVFDPP